MRKSSDRRLHGLPGTRIHESNHEVWRKHQSDSFNISMKPGKHWQRNFTENRRATPQSQSPTKVVAKPSTISLTPPFPHSVMKPLDPGIAYLPYIKNVFVQNHPNRIPNTNTKQSSKYLSFPLSHILHPPRHPRILRMDHHSGLPI